MPAEPDNLTLYLEQYEANDPEKGDYLAFLATVQNASFAGRTTFWVSRADMDGFLGELDALDTHLRGEAQLRCGWDREVYYALRLAPFGGSGRLVATVEIAALGPASRMHRVTTEMVMLPNALTGFRSALRRSVLEQRSVAAVLTAESASDA